MKNTYISATNLKKNISEILNVVYFKKYVVVIERYNKPVARIIPVEEKTEKKKSLDCVLEDYFGSLPEFPEVVKERKFSRRRALL